MKAFLAVFFLLTFSLQMLPVKEIGKILFKQQLTDEVHECECGVEDDVNCSGTQSNNDNLPYTSLKDYSNAFKWCLFKKNTVVTTSSEHILKQFSPDILTPPPNC